MGPSLSRCRLRGRPHHSHRRSRRPCVKSRASGTHYSAPGQLPFIVGVDGVGRLDDGTRVYFVLPKAPYGSVAERAVVPSTQCLPLA